VYYITLRRPVVPREQRKTSLDTHLVWMKRQHDEGKIILSGPSPDRSLGIYLIKAANREEAEAIASSDPYTVAGETAFDLIEWEVHQVLGVGPFTAAGLGH
jgi:uncharacterized protein YciI